MRHHLTWVLDVHTLQSVSNAKPSHSTDKIIAIVFVSFQSLLWAHWWIKVLPSHPNGFVNRCWPKYKLKSPNKISIIPHIPYGTYVSDQTLHTFGTDWVGPVLGNGCFGHTCCDKYISMCSLLMFSTHTNESIRLTCNKSRKRVWLLSH